MLFRKCVSEKEIIHYSQNKSDLDPFIIGNKFGL